MNSLKDEMKKIADPEKARNLMRFFKTGKGEYAEGDKFLGVMVPQSRQLVKKYWREISVDETKKLLRSDYHEERLTALLILVAKSGVSDDVSKKEIFDLCLDNIGYINNWDLVDVSAPSIVGAYLEEKDTLILFKLAASKSLWERRIAVLATFHFIKIGQPRVALDIAEVLVNDPHDLIQKAVGWMLREIGKRCGQEVEEEFLRKHYKTMPRTMLRYAIERFDDEKRRYYLGKAVQQK